MSFNPRFKELEKIVQAERQKLLDTALAGGAPEKAAKDTTDEKDAYDRVDRLSKLATDMKPSRRWVPVGLAFTVLAGAVTAILIEQKQTEVEMDLSVSEVHFQMARKGPLTGDWATKSLNATGLKAVTVNGSDWPVMKDRTCFLDARLKSNAVKADAISIPAIVRSKGWEIGLSRTGAEVTVELTAPSSNTSGTDEAISATLRGAVEATTDCTADGKRAGIPANASIEIYLSPSATIRGESLAAIAFARQIEFAGLRLYAIDRIQADGPALERRRSSVLSGKIYLDALNAKEVALRPFEDLKFASSKGYIRSLMAPASSADDFHLQAHATVERMTVGAGDNERSQMPNYLEVITAKNGFTLVWSSVVALFGILYGLARWLEWTS